VAVDEHGRLAGGVQPIGVDQRMAFALNQAAFSMPMRFSSASSKSAALRQSSLCSGSVEMDGMRSRAFSHRENGDGFGGQMQRQKKT
jgi:hypothetical protein